MEKVWKMLFTSGLLSAFNMCVFVTKLTDQQVPSWKRNPGLRCMRRPLRADDTAPSRKRSLLLRPSEPQHSPSCRTFFLNGLSQALCVPVHQVQATNKDPTLPKCFLEAGTRAISRLPHTHPHRTPGGGRVQSIAQMSLTTGTFL